MAKKKLVKKKQNSNIMKITSIVVIAIFILIIIIGVAKEYVFESKFVKLTELQIASAKAVVTSALQNDKDDISNYHFFVSQKMKHHNADKIIEVCLNNNSTRHIYLIDVNSLEIILHSKIDIYKNDINYNKEFNSCKDN